MYNFILIFAIIPDFLEPSSPLSDFSSVSILAATPTSPKPADVILSVRAKSRLRDAITMTVDTSINIEEGWMLSHRRDTITSV